MPVFVMTPQGKIMRNLILIFGLLIVGMEEIIIFQIRKLVFEWLTFKTKIQIRIIFTAIKHIKIKKQTF